VVWVWVVADGWATVEVLATVEVWVFGGGELVLGVDVAVVLQPAKIKLINKTIAIAQNTNLFT
jgi:hypothetical protein